MQGIKLLPTGVPNLDGVLGGGIPVYSLNMVAGRPGTGKTIMVQQIIFNHIRKHKAVRAIYLTTLSEPAIKVVRYMQHFRFFDSDAFDTQVLYQDIGRFIRQNPLSEVIKRIMELVDGEHPAIVAIDSVKAIRDLATDPGEFRRFLYDLSVHLASARCTTFLVGEYDHNEIAECVEFAVVDGIIYLDITDRHGEQRRFLQVYKMRGQATEMAAFPFILSDEGMHILSPTLTLRRRETSLESEADQVSSGIAGLDGLLRGGIPRGRSIILSGVSGTGKTTFVLQLLVRGAEQGERGLLFSFEETPDRLHRMAEGFGWNLKALEDRGLIRIVFVAQTDIWVEQQLEEMAREIESYKPQRFVVDSFSVFLYRVEDAATQREKTFQLATLVQRIGAIGMFTSDIPAGEPHRLSRFGVEETVMDGTIVLSTELTETQRKRYIEVYKMRAVAHVAGRHRMEISSKGIDVLYTEMLAHIGELPTPTDAACNEESDTPDVPILTRALAFEPVQQLVQGEIPYGAAWLVRGSHGIGKSTLAYQFALDGLRRKESVLYVAADVSSEQVRRALRGTGFLLEPYLESGQLVILQAYEGGRNSLDLSDPDAFLFALIRNVEAITRPCRVILDSLVPLALNITPGEFVSLVYRKNRLLRRPDVAILDIMLWDTVRDHNLSNLLNTFDVVLDLYTPNWGEMNLAGSVGYRAMQVRKARGVRADSRPFPYTISPTEGIVVQSDYYRKLVES